jgi:uroporphyrinogen decarboxylase
MGEMTPRERLLAAIRHQEPDRVPVSPRALFWMALHYGGADWLDQLRIQQEWGLDGLIHVRAPLPFYISYPFSGNYLDLPGVSLEMTVEDKGGYKLMRRRFRTPAGDLSDALIQAPPRSQYGISPTPEHREPLVKGPDDVDKLPLLFVDPCHMRGTNWREMIEVIGEKGLLQVQSCCALSGLTTGSVGMSEMMILYYSDRATFDHLLHVCHEYSQRVTRAILDQGAPILFVSWHNLDVSAGWSPKIWRDAFKPLIKAEVDLAHSYGAFYHFFDNGKMGPLLPDLAEIGVDILSSLCPPPVGDVDLAQAKQLIGDRVCLKGNIDAIYVLQKGTPEEVREAVRTAIRVAGPGGGFILGASDSILGDTPQENLDAYLSAAREFGRYPINQI